MKNWIKISACAIALFAGLAGCKDDGNALQSIVLDSGYTPIVAVGESLKPKATPYPANADFGGSFKFYIAEAMSPNPTVDVSADGTITGKSTGDTWVYVSDANNTTQIPFKVTSYVKLVDFTLAERDTTSKGATFTVPAIPVPPDATLSFAGLKYKSSDPAVAKVDENSGAFEALTPGDVVITVTAGEIVKTIAYHIKDVIVIPDATDVFTFDDPADLKAGKEGTLLEFRENTATSVDGPTATNKAVFLPKTEQLIITHGLKNLAADNKIHNYSIMYDVKLTVDGWYTFLQTDPNNADDGDIFARGPFRMGVGALGYTADNILGLDKWFRVVITVAEKTGGNNDILIYVDGVNYPTAKGSLNADPRFCLDRAKVILFGDDGNDGDDNDINVAEVRIWGETLSAAQVGELGGVPTEWFGVWSVELRKAAHTRREKKERTASPEGGRFFLGVGDLELLLYFFISSFLPLLLPTSRYPRQWF